MTCQELLFHEPLHNAVLTMMNIHVAPWVQTDWLDAVVNALIKIQFGSCNMYNCTCIIYMKGEHSFDLTTTTSHWYEVLVTLFSWLSEGSQVASPLTYRSLILQLYSVTVLTL